MYKVEQKSSILDKIEVFETEAEAVIYAKALAWEYWWNNSKYEPCEIVEKDNLWEVYVPRDEEEAEGECNDLFAEIFFWFEEGECNDYSENLKGDDNAKWTVKEKSFTVDNTKSFSERREAIIYAKSLAYDYWSEGDKLFEFDEEELRWNILSCDEKENPIELLATIWIEGESE